MKFKKAILSILIIVVIILFIVSFLFKNGEEDIFTISDDLLTYEDEIKEDKINSIYISYISKDEEEFRELNLTSPVDIIAMGGLIEKLSGIEIEKLDREGIKELEVYITKWKDRNISYNRKEIICEIRPSDTSNFGGQIWKNPERIQDKITDRIFIFSTGDIVFKMPEEAVTKENVFYTNTKDISERLEPIMEIIDSSYSRKNPQISP